MQKLNHQFSLHNMEACKILELAIQIAGLGIFDWYSQSSKDASVINFVLGFKCVVKSYIDYEWEKYRNYKRGDPLT
jgi:hypothetical protein